MHSRGARRTAEYRASAFTRPFLEVPPPLSRLCGPAPATGLSPVTTAGRQQSFFRQRIPTYQRGVCVLAQPTCAAVDRAPIELGRLCVGGCASPPCSMPRPSRQCHRCFHCRFATPTVQWTALLSRVAASARWLALSEVRRYHASSVRVGVASCCTLTVPRLCVCMCFTRNILSQDTN